MYVIFVVSSSVIRLTIKTSGNFEAGTDFSLKCEVSKTVSGLTSSLTVKWQMNTTIGEMISNISNNYEILYIKKLRTSYPKKYTCHGLYTSPIGTIIEKEKSITIKIKSRCSC